MDLRIKIRPRGNALAFGIRDWCGRRAGVVHWEREDLADARHLKQRPPVHKPNISVRCLPTRLLPEDQRKAVFAAELIRNASHCSLIEKEFVRKTINNQPLRWTKTADRIAITANA